MNLHDAHRWAPDGYVSPTDETRCSECGRGIRLEWWFGNIIALVWIVAGTIQAIRHDWDMCFALGVGCACVVAIQIIVWRVRSVIAKRRLGR